MNPFINQEMNIEEKTPIDLNISVKSNLKFNSELLNKPFNIQNNIDDKNKFSNIDNKFNESNSSAFFKNENNQNNISMISFTSSVNFNKSNEFNNSVLSDSKENKRKPFEKLTFNISTNEKNTLIDYYNNFDNSTPIVNLNSENKNFKTEKSNIFKSKDLNDIKKEKSKIINQNNNTSSKLNETDSNNKKNNNISQQNKNEKKNFNNLSKNISQSVNKCFEDTNLTELNINKSNNLNKKENQNNIISITENKINESLQGEISNISQINRSILTKAEQSTIKSQSKLLSKETLEKAKLFNIQFGDSIPFWIKFFLNLNDNIDSLESNSSYFKSDDKNKYIKNLIEMVKRDADLYDSSVKLKKVKFEGKSKLKNLLITEVKLNEKSFNLGYNDQSSIQEESKIFSDSKNLNESKIEIGNKNEELDNKTYSEINLTQDDIDKLIKDDPINEKLANVLNQYEKIEKKENLKKVENFSDFKKRLSNKNEKKNQDKHKSSSIVQSAMNKFSYPNIENIKAQFRDNYGFKTIDNFKYTENQDPFENVDYSQIELGYLEEADLKRLFEIDKKLNSLNNKIYTESINSDLYRIQKEFNIDKEKRQKINEEEYKTKMSKHLNKEIIKPSVFDVKVENNKKTEYIDYLKEIKEKSELKKEIFEIDNRIRYVKNQPIDEEKKQNIFNDLDLYYKKNPEWYEKEMKRRIPEDYNIDLAESSMKELNEELEKLKRDLDIYENNSTDNKEAEKIKEREEIKMEMIKNYDMGIQKLEEIEKENKMNLEKVDELYSKVMQDEKYKEILGIIFFNIQLFQMKKLIY